MTTPKVSTIKRAGARFYVSPETGEKVPGVTSIVDMLPAKHLQFWSAKKVAEEAVSNLGPLVGMVVGPAGPSAAVDWLKGAPRRDTAAAADLGTAAHDLFERMARGESVGRVSPELEPFVRHFQDFLDTVQPEYHFQEETVWSDTHGYAGSFDALATIEGETIFLDNKTTRSGVHEQVGLQLAAYRFADHIIRPDGGRVPLPKATGGAVVHIRPEGWSLVPIRCDEEIFDYFLHLRRVFDYETSGVKSTIKGDPVAFGPADTTLNSVPKRRAPRRKAVAA